STLLAALTYTLTQRLRKGRRLKRRNVKSCLARSLWSLNGVLRISRLHVVRITCVTVCVSSPQSRSKRCAQELGTQFLSGHRTIHRYRFGDRESGCIDRDS